MLPHGAAQQILPQGIVLRWQQALWPPGPPRRPPFPCRGEGAGSGPADLTGFSGSAPRPPVPGIAVDQLSSPSKRPVAKAAPSAAEPRASAAGIDSRGTGWAMVLVSGGGGHVCWSREDGTGTSKPTGLHLVRALPTEPRPRAPSGDTWPYCKVRLRTARHPVAACGTVSGRGVIPRTRALASMGRGGKVSVVNGGIQRDSGMLAGEVPKVKRTKNLIWSHLGSKTVSLVAGML